MGKACPMKRLITLLDNRSYPTIRLAITTRSISREALLILEQPYTGEKDTIAIACSRVFIEYGDSLHPRYAKSLRYKQS